MKRIMHFIGLLAIITVVFSSISYAGWPVFQVLSPDEVMQKVIKASCAAGEGYIPAGTEFKINNRYIPSNQAWYWIYTGTSRCQKMPTQMQALKYMFYEQDGRYAGSTISTVYGADSTGPLFSFTFTVPAEPEGWDCSPFVGHVPPTTIGCARDM